MKLGYSSDNRQDCAHCRFYLKDTPFQNDTAKLQLFHKPARRWAFFLFLPRLSRHVIPALACAWAWDLWLRLAFTFLLLSSLRVIARHEAIHLRQIHVRFISPQKKHPFHFQLLTRQQTTTVDYKRLFNGLVLTRVASLPR